MIDWRMILALLIAGPPALLLVGYFWIGASAYVVAWLGKLDMKRGERR